jgi:putative sugar O-methyltransferase
MTYSAPVEQEATPIENLDPGPESHATEKVGSRSGIWAEAARDMNDAVAGLAEFRRPGGANGRLAHWEPSESSLRWFSSYLMMAAQTTPIDERQLFDAFQETDLGQPVSAAVKYWTEEKSPQRVNLDYLYSAEELGFLTRHWPTAQDACESIVEVGAGFGRTAHAVLCAWPSVRRYTIVDLHETLRLSSTYLSRVLPDDLFGRLHFVDAGETENVQRVLERPIDLALQVDGLQEMTGEVIDAYFNGIFAVSRWCYFSTPVGKYRPESAGLPPVDPVRLAEIMALGRCRTIIDPWNETSMVQAREDCLEQYRPRNSVVVAANPSRLRPHYLHALYESLD